MPSIRTYSRALEQLVAMQAVAFADATNSAATSIARAQAMRAWECLEERKRILRSKPLPGSLRPDAGPPKRFAARKAQHASAMDMEAVAAQLTQDCRDSNGVGETLQAVSATDVGVTLHEQGEQH